MGAIDAAMSQAQTGPAADEPAHRPLDARRRKRVRRTTWLLVAIAVLVYLGFVTWAIILARS